MALQVPFTSYKLTSEELGALLNSDTSGLSDAEDEALLAFFTQRYPKGYAIQDISDEPDFAYLSVSRLLGNAYTVQVVDQRILGIMCNYKEGYDLQAFLFDLDSGNANPDTDMAAYKHTTLVANSLLNGQYIQARSQCAEYGLNYDVMKVKHDNERFT